MKKKKFLCIFLIIAICITLFAGCTTAADNVNFNLSQSAGNFEVLRKITVYNARTDLVIMDMEGYMDISNNAHSELIVTCKINENEYRKNYIYLNEYVIYVVEDITNTVTDPYHYKVHFYTALPDIDVNE